MVASIVLMVLVALASSTAASNNTWNNWDGRQICHPASVFQPFTEYDIDTALAFALQNNLTVKVAGDGHSFSPIVLTDGVLIDLTHFKTILEITDNTVIVESGIRLYEISAFLQTRGRSFGNLGAISMQSIAGATQTNTHGTGNTGGLSTFIQDFRIMLANRTIVMASESVNPDIFFAARTGMGALGIMLTMTIRTFPIWTMERITVPLPLDRLLSEVPTLRKQYERLQWYWTPYTNQGTLLLRVNTTAAITSGCWNGTSTAPVTLPPAGWPAWPAGTTACVDESYRTMTRDGDDGTLYTEMEMMVPAESDIDIITQFIAFQASVQSRHDSQWGLFTGVRYVDADDIWLSPFYQRATAVVSMIVLGNATVTGSPAEVLMYDSGLENLAFSQFQARPHPGKNNYFTYAQLKTVYPRIDDFAALRSQLDPNGVFLNAYLRRLLMPASS